MSRRHSIVVTGVALLALAGCATDAPSETPSEPPSRSAPDPSPTAEPTTASSTDSSTAVSRRPVDRMPGDPLEGEVARFWFDWPDDDSDNVAVGPYEVSRRRIVVRAACFTHSGHLTWTVFDNSDAAERRQDDSVLDHGRLRCDGETHQAFASVGRHPEVGVYAITGARRGHLDGENGWVIVANA